MSVEWIAVDFDFAARAMTALGGREVLHVCLALLLTHCNHSNTDSQIYLPLGVSATLNRGPALMPARHCDNAGRTEEGIMFARRRALSKVLN